ncbi:hypothetical protein [Methylopila sp. M107]|uniref:phage tail terminator protein n=1 Tax=Methylopila sp. M107 TaxID=1101190 RepID=UPI00036E57EE|nr:hypothetical protein [Methylopila sp. M107]
MSDPVRDAIVALVAGVPNVGRVHAYERYARESKAMAALYAEAGAVRGWFVQRPAVRRRRLSSGRELVTTTWSLTGFMSLVDTEASELELDGLVDKIIDAERADPTLGGAVRGEPVDGVLGFQLIDAGPVTFGGLLCHRVRLVLFAETYEDAGAGELANVPGASQRLIGLIVERLREYVGELNSVVGRLAFDPADDADASPFAVVSPLGDQAQLDPTSNDLDERVDIRVAVTIVASSAAPSSSGALAAGGLFAIKDAVSGSLHGWQPSAVDVPLLYTSAVLVDAGAGRVGLRLTFQPSVYIEDQTSG